MSILCVGFGKLMIRVVAWDKAMIEVANTDRVFIISMTNVIRIFEANSFCDASINPKSLFYVGKKKTFCLMHSDFLNCNNLSLAKAGRTHFCSPELFKQISSNKKGFQGDHGKSNIFSLGLMILFLLSFVSLLVYFFPV